MKSQEAEALGYQLAVLVHSERFDQAYAKLAPILAERTKFPLLERIGNPIGAGPLDQTNAFLEHVARARTEGGWVVIGAALREQLECDLAGAIDRARKYIIAADVWYATDILGERVPGQALADWFDQALEQLSPWRWDPNSWVRRAVGVAVHLWAKRSRGVAELEPRAADLMDFLEPLIPDWEMDVAKGTGWGLKTLGRYYPAAVTGWLVERLPKQPRYRAVVRNKALTYLSGQQRDRVLTGTSR
jgi:3-methyladenine DNA glycosylase AlkD